jgi:hypothetical protein
MARRHPGAGGQVGRRQQFAHRGHAGFHRLAGAAGVLHDEGLQARTLAQALRLQQAGDLVAFAAQADHQHGGQVGMAHRAGQRAAQQVHGLAGHFHAATQAMGEGGHAVDVGETPPDAPA